MKRYKARLLAAGGTEMRKKEFSTISALMFFLDHLYDGEEMVEVIDNSTNKKIRCSATPVELAALEKSLAAMDGVK